MYRISVTQTFGAAHSLRGYEGKCESLHGHNWKVEAIVCGDKLNPIGMVMDFSVVKKILTKILDELDHTHLNTIAYFKKNNPSSEYIARFIFDKLKNLLNTKVCKLEEVRVWETESACASYRED